MDGLQSDKLLLKNFSSARYPTLDLCYLFAPAKVYPFVSVPIEPHTLFLQITFLHDLDLADNHLRGKVQVNANNSANK